MGTAVELTEENFSESVASGVTLVDFWAEWCGPCRALTPILDELGADYNDKAVIAKVNVDNAQALAQKFGVSSIPTLLVIKEGEEVNRFVGITAKDVLSEALDSAIA